MKKKSLNNEIDIFELFSIIRSEKFRIILINIIIIILGLIFYTTTKPVKQIPNEKVYKIKIDIDPISIFEEFKYSEYNFNLESKIELFGAFEKINLDQLVIQPESRQLNRMGAIFLNRKSLYDYFIFQLKDEYIFKNELINFLNKFEKYQKYTDNEDIINRAIKSIKILPRENSSSIDFQHYNLEIELEEVEVKLIKLFFGEYEKYINHSLKTLFVKEFEKSIKNMMFEIDNEINRIKQIILNLNNVLENPLSLENKRKELEFRLEYLKITKQIENEKLIKILKESPLNAENFNGARLNTNSLNIKQINFIQNNRNTTMASIVISSIFFGSIISILYVLFIYAYRKRVSNRVSN
jgi:hypothetical protein